MNGLGVNRARMAAFAGAVAFPVALVLGANPLVAQELKPASALVVDQAGKTIGPLLRPNQVLLTLGGFTAYSIVQREEFTKYLGDTYANYFYSGTACSGTPYLDATNFPVRAFVTQQDNLAFPNAAVESQQIASELNEYPGSPCHAIAASTRRVVRFRLYRVTNLGFTPPFSVRLAQ